MVSVGRRLEVPERRREHGVGELRLCVDLLLQSSKTPPCFKDAGLRSLAHTVLDCPLRVPPADTFQGHPSGRRAHVGVLHGQHPQSEYAAGLCRCRGRVRGLVRGTRPQDLAALRPVHLAAYIEHLQGRLSAPTVKLHLAAVRGLFDWLVSARLCLSTRPARCAARGTPCAREKPLC